MFQTTQKNLSGASIKSLILRDFFFPVRMYSWLNMHISMHFGYGPTGFWRTILLLVWDHWFWHSMQHMLDCRLSYLMMIRPYFQYVNISCPTIFGKDTQIVFQIFKICVMKEKRNLSPAFPILGCDGTHQSALYP